MSPSRCFEVGVLLRVDLGRPTAGQNDEGDVAGQKAQDDEDEDGDKEEGGNDEEQAADDVGLHDVRLLRRLGDHESRKA